MRTLTLEERDQQIQAKLDAGVQIPDQALLTNDGQRRTQSKRELLAALREHRERAGLPDVFKARF